MSAATRLADFRTEHGPVESWSAEDFEVYQDLAHAAHTGRWRRTRRRAQALVVLLYATPLYTLAELVTAHGQSWPRLNRLLDRVGDQLTTAEDRCLATGDTEWVHRVGDRIDRYADAVDRLTSRHPHTR
ncbi:hypothetical protein OG330_31050 (plasmid) [Streptomyces albidoflavus]|uniref:Uncharacterized protein n=1 Tax=Streptomyces albidoflavus TaxID=1886 RepID=A0A8G1ZJU6_9ACTN|nr:hypothetical protein [Streptomyces albidoflavus]RZE15338.1 hypothetical protein C0Q92_31075 [Streptomyces albidoflavus]WSU19613.1 hypothetical protein OG330_31050 [Streptomyces albidoflavus]WTC33773.1 hypothetical protein OH749_31170 [Streptomyces albidoflavus]CAI4198584.1 hypothetical protein CCOS2040_31255 [Streptomyces albidoflavus]